MMIVKVKICGITNYEDAVAATDMGADILGFNFYPHSPRYVTPLQAYDIIKKLPAFIDLAGVFVNASLNQIREVMETCPLGWLQLHGDESPEFCREFLSFDVKVIKAIRVRDKEDIAKAELYFTDAVLIDSYNPESYGGTGMTFDWNIIGNISKRIFLAGGINPENVAQAVQLGVHGIDVCSGIESEKGKKDHKKMQQLFDNIRHLRA